MNLCHPMTSLTTKSTPPTVDVALAVAFAVLTQTEVWVFASDDGYAIGVRLGASALTLIASAALAYRRHRPATSFFVNGVAVIGTIIVGYPSDIYQWTNLFAIYSLGAYGAGWARWAGLPVGVAGVISYFVRFPDEGSFALAAFAASMWVVAWLAGRMYGARIEEGQLRLERDLSMGLAQANEERLALEEERNRIARELHDIVGHTVNVMVVHAEAGRREMGRDDEGVLRAFETIARTGRDALGELDRVLAVLRRDEGEPALASTPGMADLERLATTFAETGLEVELDVSGGLERVPTSVGLASYRFVQEALTNTLKHAGAAHAEVSVEIGDSHLRIEVVDDGAGAQGDAHPGRGILGMRERAALHGGGVEVSTDAQGRFKISADLRWDQSA